MLPLDARAEVAAQLVEAQLAHIPQHVFKQFLRSLQRDVRAAKLGALAAVPLEVARVPTAAVYAPPQPGADTNCVGLLPDSADAERESSGFASIDPQQFFQKREAFDPHDPSSFLPLVPSSRSPKMCRSHGKRPTFCDQRRRANGWSWGSG